VICKDRKCAIRQYDQKFHTGTGTIETVTQCLQNT